MLLVNLMKNMFHDDILLLLLSQSSEKFFTTYSNFNKNQIDLLKSFEQVAQKAKLLLDTPQLCLNPYEQALASKLLK